MAEWSSWLPDLRIHLPMCPTPLIEHAVKRAAQEFCSKTGVWKALLDERVAVPAYEPSVTLTPDSNAEIVQTLDLWIDGKALHKTTAEEVLKDHPEWVGEVGFPKAWIEDEPGVLRLFPTPDVATATGLMARVSLKPSETATGVGDVIASRYRENVADKALSILMAHPGKAWTNMEQAMFRLSLFEAATAEIRTRLALEHVRVRSRPVWC